MDIDPRFTQSEGTVREIQKRRNRLRSSRHKKLDKWPDYNENFDGFRQREESNL